MKKIYLYPMPARRVVDPKNMQALPDGGALVEFSIFMRRRMRDGDAFEGEPGKVPEAVAKARALLEPPKPKPKPAAKPTVSKD